MSRADDLPVTEPVMRDYIFCDGLGALHAGGDGDLARLVFHSDQLTVNGSVRIVRARIIMPGRGLLEMTRRLRETVLRG